MFLHSLWPEPLAELGILHSPLGEQQSGGAEMPRLVPEHGKQATEPKTRVAQSTTVRPFALAVAMMKLAICAPILSQAFLTPLNGYLGINGLRKRNTRLWVK